MYSSPLYFALGGRRGIGYADYRADEAMYRRYFARKVQCLGRFAKPGRLFEVGAATGYFLDEARKAGWTVSGVEVSPKAAEYARNELGLDVRTGRLEDLVIEPGRYDAIAVLQTIEHLPEPRTALRAMHAAVRAGGFLLLTTPDSRSAVARLMGRYWPSYRPEHLWYFDRNRISSLVEEAGWRRVRVRGDDPLFAPLSRLLERARHYYGVRLALPRLTGDVRVPVWLGDLEVIARR